MRKTDIPLFVHRERISVLHGRRHLAELLKLRELYGTHRQRVADGRHESHLPRWLLAQPRCAVARCVRLPLFQVSVFFNCYFYCSVSQQKTEPK